MRKHFRRHLIAGIVTLVPLVVTVLFVWWMIDKTDVLTNALVKRGILPKHIPGMGLVLSIILIYLVGILVNNYIGKKFVRLGEMIIERLPIVKTIYTSLKQVANSFNLSRKGFFEKVVLIEYPKDGIWTIGFVTSRSKGEVQEKIRENVMNIFVPTTPNPTSGLLIMVPEKNIIQTRMTVEEGMKLIISGGLATPMEKEEPAEGS